MSDLTRERVAAPGPQWAAGATVLRDWSQQRQLISGAGGGVSFLLLPTQQLWAWWGQQSLNPDQSWQGFWVLFLEA